MPEADTYSVYMHRLKSDGRVYIGQSCDPEKRWGKNGQRYKGSHHFMSAINKYGWDSFEHIILKDNLSKEEADYYEDYYIAVYDSMNRNHGFNLRYGGSHGKYSEEAKKRIAGIHSGKNHPLWGKHHSEETRKKISEANKGKKRGPLSEETKQKLSELNKGKVFSDETKAKISKANTGKTRTQKQKREMSALFGGKPVMCVETGEVFVSVKEAGRAKDVSHASISHCAKGQRKRAGGYHWVYVKEGETSA